MSRSSLSTPQFLVLMLGLLLSNQPGCSEPLNSTSAGLAPVSGTVLLDGQPAARAKVVFLPQQLFTPNTRVQPVAAALTDEQGNFSLQTAGKPGANAGTYWVLLSKLDASLASDEEPSDKEDPQPEPSSNQKEAEPAPLRNGAETGPEEVFPEFFNSATRLTFVVPEQGTQSARFELSIFDRPLEPARRQ
jgi:hypothetical protein